jgi:hypothetical protein
METYNMEEGQKKAWVAIAGKWKFEGDSACYLGPDENSPFPHGIALTRSRFRSGSIKTTVHFFKNLDDLAARLIFGYNPETKEYFSFGLGGYGFAYVLDEFLPGRGWQAFAAAGNKENFSPNCDTTIEINIFGQKGSLIVNDVKVLEGNLPKSITGDQIGLFAWGHGPVEFKNTINISTRPKAFVIMEFQEPYDSLYSEVILPVAEQMGLEAYRADEVYRPGIILQDIIRGIIEAEVIIAEITPPNANVFYELGYSHAIGKPTILLAEKTDKKLPFDISGYRCIFYDNTIRGKKDVENQLRKHLASILG